jgi:hypothetical protein
MSWRGDELTIERPAAFLYPGEVSGVTQLGSDEKLTFEQTRGPSRSAHPAKKSASMPSRSRRIGHSRGSFGF